MIEADVIAYLTDTMSVPVYAERPEDPDPSYILIEQTGEYESNHLRHGTVACQAYAPSRLDAAILCESLILAMHDITDLDRISHCNLNSAYNYTDTRTKEYRYQAVFDLVYTM